MQISNVQTLKHETLVLKTFPILTPARMCNQNWPTELSVGVNVLCLFCLISWPLARCGY